MGLVQLFQDRHNDRGTHVEPDYYTYGKKVKIEHLKNPRALEFAETVKKYNYAKFRRVLKKDNIEAVEFDVSAEIPTRPVADIQKSERICVVFPEDKNITPKFLALRKSFPSELLHLNLINCGEPRSLCLFEEGYRELKTILTTEILLLRIISWLSRAASGEQHLPGQPLEPFIRTPEQIIYDPEDLVRDLIDRLLVLVPMGGKSRPIYKTVSIPMEEIDKNLSDQLYYIAVPIYTIPWHARVINETPASLKDLDILLKAVGANLIEKLQTKTVEIYSLKNHGLLLNYKWALVVTLPKIREFGGDVETYEVLTFFVNKSIGELGCMLGVLGKHNGTWARVIGEPKHEELEECRVSPTSTMPVFRRDLANKLADMKIDSKVKITAVGAGALGSQIISNLARQGIGQWLIIDNDNLLPHNHSRFALSPNYEGINKAVALAQEVVTLLNDEKAAKGFDQDIFKIDASSQEGKECFYQVDHIFDFSVSPAVSTHLGLMHDRAPVTSVFLLQKGHVLIIISEGIKHEVRLDDLEVQLAVATIGNPDLGGLLRAPEGPRIRYSGACGDVTTVLSQDVVATQAGVASQFLKRNMNNESACISIWILSAENLDIFRKEVQTHSVNTKSIGEWEVRVSQNVISSMRAYRKLKLPNETGGVLLGCINISDKIVYVGSVLPSPRDSEEWPTVYRRGVKGLRKSIEFIKSETGGNLTYVGEWHSHPGAGRARPSNDDLKAHSWLAEEMGEEGYPGVMLIQGGKGNPYVLLAHRG